jgi:PPOX class probable F420-dependent enzyme
MRLDPDAAAGLLAGQRVARLATVDERARPHLVPVVFAAWERTIVIAVDHKPKSTRDLRRLRNVRANPAVAVLADRYDDEDWARLWWVRADGRATVLTEPADLADPIDRLVEKYPQYQQIRPEGPVIRIAVERYSGWAAA